MKKIAIVVIAMSLLFIGVAMAQTICPWDPAPSEELPVESLNVDSSLALMCNGNTFVTESMTTSGLSSGTFMVGSTRGKLDGMTGNTEMSSVSTMSVIGGSATMVRESNIGYGSGTGLEFEDTHFLLAATPKPLDENTTIPFCTQVSGGTSGVIRSGEVASIVAADLAPDSISLDYGVIIGQDIANDNPLAAVGSFRTFESSLVISGNNVNGTAIPDYKSKYDMSARASGEVVMSRLFTYSLQV